ncbi:TPA: hypothetical protein ACIYM4_003285 [Escherichia coli]
MFKHWKNITIYKLSREADLTDLEDKKKMILFTPCGSQRKTAENPRPMRAGRKGGKARRALKKIIPALTGFERKP